ncbi:MAG: hypothetical protein JNL58_23595 [Planctomyces sp.]|nr:hypothetical protein [Planctomyces sp.]
MAQEIIYTSAEKGLKQGSRGFCTVVSTAGMAVNLAERLESMSGYRQAFPMGDPRASQNPVCWSHVSTRLAGKTLHIISRIADAGQDYTGRSNKLAHHVAIESIAGLSAGPARILRQPGVMVDRWNGEVKTVSPRELPSVQTPAEISLSAWKNITGDHGWAGAVAEQLTTSPAPLNVIFNVGMDAAGLVQEVIDLLPASQKWAVTFSTYFTRLLAGTECQLRFVLNDTPEATALRNDAKARVIDLTKSLPAASGGSLVTTAREGVVRPDAPKSESANAFSDLKAAARSRGTSASMSAAGAPIASERAVPTIPKPVSIDSGSASRPALPLSGRSVQARSPKGKWILIAVVLLIVAGIGTATVITSGGGPDKFGDLLAKSQSKDTDAVDPELERMKREAEDRRKEEELQKEKQLASEKAEKERKAEEARVAQEKSNADAMAKAKAESERKMAEEQRLNALKEEGPFAFIKASVNAKDGQWHDEHGQWLFELPKPRAGEKSKALSLRTLSKPVTLRLFEGAREALEVNNFKLAVEVNPEVPFEWRLVYKQGASTQHLGSYTLETLDTGGNPEKPDLELRFEWMQEASRESMACELARWWPLEIQVGDQTERAVLLQRPPFVPLNPPTTADFLADKELVFSSGDELKCLGDNAAKAMTFRMQMTEPRQDPQTLEFRLTAAATGDDGQGDFESNFDAAPNRAFFPLATPIIFSKVPPNEDTVGVGFGSLSLLPELSVGALAIKSEIDLRVKLPSKEYVEGLPTLEVNRFLEMLVKSIVGDNVENGVRKQLHNFLADVAERELSKLKNESESYLDDKSRWYAHSLKRNKLPLKTTWKVPFYALKTKACTAAAVVRNQTSMPPAGSDDATFQKFDRIDKFVPIMNRTADAVRDAEKLLMKDYDQIQSQLTAVRTAINNSRMRFVLLTKVSTPGAKNGNELTLYVLDSAPGGIVPAAEAAALNTESISKEVPIPVAQTPNKLPVPVAAEAIGNP